MDDNIEKNIKRETGGYYALKGFAYQIDKAILEIIKPENSEQVDIEKIQDISSQHYVLQVKYKETQNYSNSKVKEPILQLVEEFILDPSKEYRLYCYFKDKQSSALKLNMGMLNDILTPIDGSSSKSLKINQRIQNLAEDKKEEFLNKFKIIYAPEFQEQFIEVLNNIGDLSGGQPDLDLAVLYYSWIYSYIVQKVTESPNGSSVNKQEIVELIKSGKKMVFDSCYEAFLGHEKYVQLVKNKFVRLNFKKENFVFIGHIDQNEAVSVFGFIQGITDSYFDKATYDIRPLNFVVSDNIRDELLRSLCGSGELFNEGYESISFNPKIFSSDHLYTKKATGVKRKATETLDKISFRFRLISSSTYQSFADQITLSPDMVYLLGSHLDSYPDIPSIKIEGLDTKELLELFTK